MRLREVSFHEPMYQTDISYLYGGTPLDLIKFIEKRHGDSPPISWSEVFNWGTDADTTDGYQFHVNAPLGRGERFYVWMAEVSPSLIFHETFHLVGDILHTRGISYSLESEEAFAYLGGYIFEEVYKLLRGKLRKK